MVIEQFPHSSASNFQSKKTQPGDLPEKRHIGGVPTFHPPPTPLPVWLSQFVQFTVTLQHSTIIIPHTHQISGMSESTGISILQITTTSFYHFFVMTPPKLSGIMPELPVLCLMNLVLCNLVNGPE